jgi:hypothetical protein
MSPSSAHPAPDPAALPRRNAGSPRQADAPTGPSTPKCATEGGMLPGPVQDAARCSGDPTGSCTRGRACPHRPHTGPLTDPAALPARRAQGVRWKGGWPPEVCDPAGDGRLCRRGSHTPRNPPLDRTVRRRLPPRGPPPTCIPGVCPSHCHGGTPRRRRSTPPRSQVRDRGGVGIERWPESGDHRVRSGWPDRERTTAGPTRRSPSCVLLGNTTAGPTLRSPSCVLLGNTTAGPTRRSVTCVLLGNKIAGPTRRSVTCVLRTEPVGR